MGGGQEEWALGLGGKCAGGDGLALWSQVEMRSPSSLDGGSGQGREEELGNREAGVPPGWRVSQAEQGLPGSCAPGASDKTILEARALAGVVN